VAGLTQRLQSRVQRAIRRNTSPIKGNFPPRGSLERRNARRSAMAMASATEKTLQDLFLETLKTGQLGMADAAKLIEQTLEKEIKTDRLLTDFAAKQVNARAA